MRFLLCVALFFASGVVVTARGDAVDTQRRAFENAFRIVEHDPRPKWAAATAGLESYALYPYLEFAGLTRDLAHVAPDAARDFLARYDGSPLADDLRTRWLKALAEDGRWAEFLAIWRERGDLELRCHYVVARLRTNDLTGLQDQAQALWLAPRSLPSACDPMIAWLGSLHAYNEALVWKRIELVAAARLLPLVPHLSRLLPAAQRPEAQAWAKTLGNPAAALGAATKLNDTTRNRSLVVLALTQLARRDADGAAALWSLWSGRLKFDEAERGRVLAAIALYKAASFAADADVWLKRVPDAAYDDGLREWRVRSALSRGDYAGALVAIGQLAPGQQLDPRFRYLRARLLEETGQKSAGLAALQVLSSEANFHGFLAADRVGAPYTICPLQASADKAVRERVANTPGLIRAFELYAIGWPTQARREWDYVVRDASTQTRTVAVALAAERDWLERGPLSLLKPDELRYYTLRFPLGYVDEVRTHARRNGLEASWVFGLIRSESAWMTDAHSGANARGLMQLLPSTAKPLAKREHLHYGGPNDLYRPPLNIALGTRHLADVLARYDGREWLATAAYNAGPAPVERWLSQRPGLPTDLWIETIPYRETREYVSRVMAFSVIYDWLLDGKAASLLARLRMSDDPHAATTRRAIVCAVPASPAIAGPKP